jgi:CDP-glucose 4,6-dehydratase
MKEMWPAISYHTDSSSDTKHEALKLTLNTKKAQEMLSWSPVWDFPTTVRKTVEWYRNFCTDNQVRTEEDLISYIRDAQDRQTLWST